MHLMDTIDNKCYFKLIYQKYILKFSSEQIHRTLEIKKDPITLKV